MRLSQTPEVDPSCGCKLASVAVRPSKKERAKQHCVRAGSRVLGCFTRKDEARRLARDHNKNPRTRTQARVVGNVKKLGLAAAGRKKRSDRP